MAPTGQGWHELRLARFQVRPSAAFKPRNGWQDWQASTIDTVIIRINRSERIERKLRDLASYHALDFWKENQKLAIKSLTLRPARDPAKVITRFRQTRAGLDWMLARWEILTQAEPAAWGNDLRDLKACPPPAQVARRPVSRRDPDRWENPARRSAIRVRSA